MGCPDWPKCFGAWIPPPSEAQLPVDYKQQYVEYRHEKNVRFARYLDALGFKNKADLIRNDESVNSETTFNVYKTWTEYINRLVGSLIGLFVIINLIASYPIRKTNRKIFVYSILLLVTVVFQGWIGSIVVSTNLVPWMVTVHMLLAMLIVAITIYLIYLSRRPEIDQKIEVSPQPVVKALIMISLVLLGIQVILGTQVRETIDTIAASMNFQSRTLWVSRAGLSFIIHRSFSLLILISQALIIYYLVKAPGKDRLMVRLARVLIGFTVLEVILGAIMAYAGIPAFIQPVHLLIAIMVFGFEFILILISQHKKAMLA